MNTQPALEVSHLSYAYGTKTALEKVSFEVARGECCILLGPNGAGKSTLFSLITRLFDARSGEIRIAGHDLRRSSLKALAALGVVFQQSTLDLDLSVRDNLLYHAALYGIDRRTARERMQAELERMGMPERINEIVRNLNGGHRRRVEIARALLHKPSLLLLDEPTVGLDVPSRKTLVEHVHRLCRETGISVLWATHLMDEIENQDGLAILHRGKILARGKLPEVLAATGTDNIATAFEMLTQDKGP